MQIPIASIKKAEAGLHGSGEYFISLQRQFRLFFLGSGQYDRSDNLE
jgi:hypothetical protein